MSSSASFSDIAISVRGLSKSYTIVHEDQKHTLATEALLHSLKNIGKKPTSETFWALQDVSFDIHKGDVVGIIGRNGAGKSTLLKVLSRITEPTRGQIDLYGRVGSLLEVGTGFHPELTGRENVYLNGAILGMSKREIASHFDAIVEFAEVERFLDTPVKRYSSGMYVRLAFAVAAHLSPEILIVDEVLAVGDAAFQKKCLGKMQDVAAHGRTVLFVSHNMGTVASLCTRAVWMRQGKVHQIGPVRSTVDAYMGENFNTARAFIDLHAEPRLQWMGDRLRLLSISFNGGKPLVYRAPWTVSIEYETYASLEDVVFGFGLSTMEGTRLMTIESDQSDGVPPSGLRRSFARGMRGRVEIKMDQLWLQPGRYALDVGARTGENSGLDYTPACATVEVLPGPDAVGALYDVAWGVRPPAVWHWDKHDRYAGLDTETTLQDTLS